MEFISQFLEMLLAERALSKNSILSYKRDLLDLRNYLVKQKLSELNITAENIRNWIEYLAENGLQARSINRKISTIKSYYEFLISENHTNLNPLLNVDLPKYPHYMTIFHFVISGWQNIECKSLIQRADWVEILYKIVTNV
ncbi:MAG TPA: site-specific integrase, partial [Rickettsia endosymbiont of Diachasma alloeum]|nr:site-specific integrase [Rickettsia endosymbiont of Diachasma alloeum]